ncbi:MAG: S8 family serine peptidase [Proteobacteria bacterium]|jgi:hypothetical protein|nr:S8 family serine peptidase [Pseudomonadota bacterium]
MKVLTLVLFFPLAAFAKNLRVAIIDTGIDRQNFPSVRAESCSPKLESTDDLHGHGTHIGGLIYKNNSRIEYISLKYYDEKATGEENLKNLLRCFQRSLELDVDVINFSGGGPIPSSAERAMMEKIFQKRILFVAAAGNESRSIDRWGFYPASYGFTNILSVASVNADFHLLRSSNYGVNHVNIAALGENILSTLPNGQKGLMTGTSQATALVTRLALEMILVESSFRRQPEALIRHLTETGLYRPQLSGKVSSARVLNSQRALERRSSAQEASGIVIRNPARIRKTIHQILTKDSLSRTASQ